MESNKTDYELELELKRIMEKKGYKVTIFEGGSKIEKINKKHRKKLSARQED